MEKGSDRSIKQAVEMLSGTELADKVYIMTGTVISINEPAGTCSVEAITGKATTQIDNVEFQAVVADGIDIIPVMGSEVKVIWSKYTQPFIAQYSEVDKIFIAGNLVHFNEGQLGGMVKVITLTEKLNNLESKVNSIMSSYNSHIHSNGNMGSPTGAPLVPITGTLTPTNQSDIEDTKIIH
jgi:hypothetical protein